MLLTELNCSMLSYAILCKIAEVENIWNFSEHFFPLSPG
jgi:hypothetical protein